eukprot:gene11144-14953_t
MVHNMLPIKSLFSTLPIFLIRHLSFEWLDIIDWVNMDSAVCSHADRQLLTLANYGGNNSIKCIDMDKFDLGRIYYEKNNLCNDMFNWIERNRIYVFQLMDIDLFTLSSHPIFVNEEFCRRINLLHPFYDPDMLSEDGDDDSRSEDDHYEEIMNRFKLALFGLSCAAVNFSNVTSLDLSGCYSLVDNYSLKILLKLKNLTNLGLNHCSKITDLSLVFISKRSQQLEHLSLFSCNNITDFGMLEFSRNMKKIKFLDISNCEMIGQDLLIFHNWICNCKSLTNLNLHRHDLTELSMDLIRSNLTNLTVFKFSCQTNSYTLELIESYVHSNHIHCLHMQRIYSSHNIVIINKKQFPTAWNEMEINLSTKLDNADMIRLSSALSCISTLKLTNELFQFSSSLLVVRFSKIFTNLDEIVLQTASIRNEMITVICYSFQKLKKFSFVDVSMTTVDVLEIVSNLLKDLRYFSISSNNYITSEDMHQFCFNLPNLKDLRIINCYGIIDKSWISLFPEKYIEIQMDTM